MLLFSLCKKKEVKMPMNEKEVVLAEEDTDSGKKEETEELETIETQSNVAPVLA